MSIQDDETLKMYVEESLEHMSDIENDLLAIEEAGADIDEGLVNKVFRAAHSIKGGAGFMGLNNIKELSHKMENILGMIRSGEMVPGSEIINTLLLSSDALRNLINSVSTSDEMDVSEHINNLSRMTANALPDNEKDSVSRFVDISYPDGTTPFKVAEYDISHLRKKGKFIYLCEYDLIRDIHRKDRTPHEVLKDLEKSGIIIESKIDIVAVGTLDDVVSKRIPFLILFATILEPDMIGTLFQIDESRLYEMADDFTLKPIVQVSAVETPPETSAHKLEESLLAESAGGPGKRDEKPVDKSTGAPAAVSDTSLRVPVSLLDHLMNLAGELVLGRNQLLQAVSANDLRTIETAGQRLDLITTELQEAIMLTRMQPIGNVFNKFPRVVRDLAKNLGKEVNLTLEGKEVELDKTIIEAISDPLTHLIRNSVDHGIEKPDVRQREGKSEIGEIILKAYHQAGQVNIEIQDDGKGLNGDKIAGSAVAKDLMTEEQIKIMSEKEKVSLIFLPGFSTAEMVTDVSGRGVGMDVVKTNLDKLGGHVDIDTQPGRGTTIRIKLPLTLAIIPSQIISTGGERYAIPQVNLEELLRIPANQVKNKIERVGNADVVRLRGQLLPLLGLAEVLELDRIYFNVQAGEERPDRRRSIVSNQSKVCPAENTESELCVPGSDEAPLDQKERRYQATSAVNIVVVTAGPIKYGLVVDQLHDSEEIVVKPLGRHMKNCKGYAGATIMGDGRVALILDVGGLAQMAELTSLEGTESAAELAKDAVETKKDTQSLLTFNNAEDEQFAVPLSLVSRIEKIKKKSIETVGGKKVIKHRGNTLPLIAVEEVANVKPLRDKDDLLVIVFLLANKEVGLLATSPVDAVEISTEIDDSTLKQPGILGSAIIGEHTTLIVDIFGLVDQVNPEWFSNQENIEKPKGENLPTILFAEDSDFFRNQVKGFMEDDGYKVISAEDGLIAWNLLQQHVEEICLVVTDIEMPNLNGFELARKIKDDERYKHLPVMALTTLAGDEDISRGKEAGIDEYQFKMDRERLRESFRRFLPSA